MSIAFTASFNSRMAALRRQKLITVIFAVLMLPHVSWCLDNGLGRTPVLGFNSWNIFACEVTEAKMKATMDAVVAFGLREAGYKYISVDVRCLLCFDLQRL